MATGEVYRVQSSPPKKRQRVYQQWQGNETFFCWGYLVAGPNWRASLGTAFLLLAPSGIFLAFVAPYVAFKTHIIILVISCILPVLCALFLFLTACRDPGIIPRQEPDEEYLAGRKPRTQEVQVNGHRVIIRYNDTCHFYQPPRAHHCSVNDNCIERFDHHCPWVGTTIGKRNYRTFLLFVFTATVLCLYVMGCCLAQLFLRHNQLVDDDQAAGGDGSGEWGHTLRDVIPALVLLGYCFMFLWFVGGLSGFHCYLTATNQTTYENFRYNHDNRANPFDRGILANCAEVWCTKIPPSQVDFRAFVDEVKPRPGMPPTGAELVPPYQAPPTHPTTTMGVHGASGAGALMDARGSGGGGLADANNGMYHTPFYTGGTVATSSFHPRAAPPYMQPQQQQQGVELQGGPHGLHGPHGLPAGGSADGAASMQVPVASMQVPVAPQPGLARAEAFVPGQVQGGVAAAPAGVQQQQQQQAAQQGPLAGGVMQAG